VGLDSFIAAFVAVGTNCGAGHKVEIREKQLDERQGDFVIDLPAIFGAGYMHIKQSSRFAGL
jgi:hypothetical protein